MKLGIAILWLGVAGAQQLPKAVPPAPVAATTVPKWRVKFFYDKNESAMEFRELLTPAEGMVCAFGALAEEGRKPHGVMVNSRDGGKTWQTIKLPDVPLAADFIDRQNGWLVANDAVHRTRDGGLTWRRASKLKGVRRVKFLTAERGFAVGYPKAVWSTGDGGGTWEKVPEAALPEAKAENTAYNTIAFANAEHGVITGFSRPPRRDDTRAPPWMDPEVQKRLVPHLTVVLQTMDGGKTWKPHVASAFGQLTKTVFGAAGLALMDYSAGTFSYASEVINLANSKSAFADQEKAISDLAFEAGGRAWISGIEVPGKLNHLPIPSRVVVLQSIDYQHWYGTPVDYRAVANRVHISFAGHQGWLATDTGMILALE